MQTPQVTNPKVMVGDSNLAKLSSIDTIISNVESDANCPKFGYEGVVYWDETHVKGLKIHLDSPNGNDFIFVRESAVPGLKEILGVQKDDQLVGKPVKAYYLGPHLYAFDPLPDN